VTVKKYQHSDCTDGSTVGNVVVVVIWFLGHGIGEERTVGDLGVGDAFGFGKSQIVFRKPNLGTVDG
jgi:hypothetical protein